MEADFAATTWGAKICQPAEVHQLDTGGLSALGARADRLLGSSYMRGGGGR
jgi:hypothetical protein